MVYYGTDLTLYSTEIDPRRNLFIDEIEQYLSRTSIKWAFDEFKRFTPSQSVTVKLSVEDAALAVGSYLSARCNYARVTYSDSASANFFYWYYFVSSIEMIADGTLAVTLQLDAINSFRNWKGALTERTYVMRHLINRWDADGRPIAVFSSEGTSGKIVKASEAEIASSPCYLIYETADGEPTLHCTDKEGLLVKNSVLIKNEWLASRISALAISPEYMMSGASSKKVTINYRITSSQSMKTYTLSSTDTLSVGVRQSAYKNSSGVTNYVINIWVRKGDATTPTWQTKYSTGVNPTALDYIEIVGSGSFNLVQCAADITIDTSGTITYVEPGARTACQTEPIASIDRTKSTLFKIVEIPFTPDVGEYGRFVWDKDSIYFEFDDLESQITYTDKIYLDNIIRKRPDSYASASEAMADDPKLFSGEFSYYKVVYDSYSTVISLENLNTSATDVYLKWTGSTAMSSSSIFQVMQKNGNVAVTPLNIEEDYPFLISSDRNNELPLYNSEWLNYLRVGYNYDKKTNAMSIATSVLSTVGSFIMAAATAASGGLTAPVTAGLAVGLAGAAVSGWSSTASTINSQVAKETQLKNQSFSVASVNDLSLFKAYGNATAKVEWWEPREDYRAQLEALFFYKGYARGWQYSPDLSIRTDFDYIECVPAWSGKFIEQTPPQFISLLSDRLAEGVTIIHCNNWTWDISQEKGNIEK